MPFDSSGQGEYAAARFVRKFFPKTSEAIRMEFEAGLGQVPIRPPIEQELPVLAAQDPRPRPELQGFLNGLLPNGPGAGGGGNGGGGGGYGPGEEGDGAGSGSGIASGSESGTGSGSGSGSGSASGTGTGTGTNYPDYNCDDGCGSILGNFCPCVTTFLDPVLCPAALLTTSGQVLSLCGCFSDTWVLQGVGPEVNCTNVDPAVILGRPLCGKCCDDCAKNLETSPGVYTSRCCQEAAANGGVQDPEYCCEILSFCCYINSALSPPIVSYGCDCLAP
jgi:hypothetical protein